MLRPRMIALILLNEGTQDSTLMSSSIGSSSRGKWLNSEGYIGFGKVQTLGLCNSNTRKVQGGSKPQARPWALIVWVLLSLSSFCWGLMCHTSLARPSWEELRERECGYWRKLIRESFLIEEILGLSAIEVELKRTHTSHFHFIEIQFSQEKAASRRTLFMLCCDIDTQIIYQALWAASRPRSFFYRSAAIYHPREGSGRRKN